VIWITNGTIKLASVITSWRTTAGTAAGLIAMMASTGMIGGMEQFAGARATFSVRLPLASGP